MVADAADIAGAEPQRLQRDQSVLGRQRRIDRGQPKAFQLDESFATISMFGSDGPEAGQMGNHAEHE